MPLTATAIRNARPGEKPAKLTDGKGLYLLVTPKGGKWWRLDYRFHGKRKTLSMGTYPEVSLKEARDRRDSARKLLADGVDPSEHRKAMKRARTDLFFYLYLENRDLHPTSLRLHPDLVDRADRLRPLMEEDPEYNIGRVSRALVLRLAVLRGLERLERKYGATEGTDT